MTTNAKHGLFDLVRDAMTEWHVRRATLDADVVRALADAGMKVSADEAPLVVASIVKASVEGIHLWDFDEQSGELNELPDATTLASLPPYDACVSLLNWAETHGLGDRIEGIYDGLANQLGAEAESLIPYLMSHRGTVATS